MILPITVMLVAAQTIYVAQTPSFGCSSIEDVRELSAIRADTERFETKLLQSLVQGQCALIAVGTVVEGVATDDASMLLIQAEHDPPGYLAPTSDFVVRDDTPTPTGKH